MLITFKSAASGDLITFEKNARQMLKVLGKDRDDGQGIGPDRLRIPADGEELKDWASG